MARTSRYPLRQFNADGTPIGNSKDSPKFKANGRARRVKDRVIFTVEEVQPDGRLKFRDQKGIFDPSYFVPL